MIQSSLIVTALLAAASAASAAILTNPILATGSDAIDPSAGETLNSNATATLGTHTNQATLEARADFAVNQTWGPFRSMYINPANYIDFTDSRDTTRPDIKFHFTGTYASTDSNGGAGGQTTNTGLATSFNSSASNYAVRMAGDAAGTVTTPNLFSMIIDFGEYNAGDATFNSNVNAVAAAGFAIANAKLNSLYTVEFQRDDGFVLGRQTATGAQEGTAGSTDGHDFFFGFQSTQYEIGKIVITRRSTSDGTVGNGLDDLGFSTIPEPVTLAFAPAAALLLGRRRRA